MVLLLPVRSGLPAGMAGRIATLILDAVAGVVALPALWLLEGLALQVLHLTPTEAWVNNVLVGLPCLLWLAALLALARRGRTPACVVTRRRWVTATGQPAPWGPLGGLSFWIAALSVLFIVLSWVEEFCLLGQANAWDLLPPFANINAGVEAACLMIAAIALPPYLRCRGQAACVRLTPR